jgi:GNAT superfamily N-acetyltransferase
MFFRKYHYKSGCLGTASHCFVATLFGEPVAFTAILNNGVNLVKNSISPPASKAWAKSHVAESAQEWREWASANYPARWNDWEMLREHRTVVIPCFQGIGVGSLLADSVAYICQRMGYAFSSLTVHPQYGGYRDVSPFWRAMPTSQKERSAIKGNLKFCHVWVGAHRPDGSIDPDLKARLEDRMDLSNLQDLVNTFEP